MTSLKEVKEEIDNNANGKIDTQEMVDFLKDEKREENFQKLRDGLDEELRFNVEETDSDGNTFIEKEKNYKLIEEFETAMKEICGKIIEMKENVTPNQFRILLFYLEYFGPEIEEQGDVKMEKIEEEIKKLEEEKAKLKNELEEIKKQKTALINELQSSIGDEKKEKEKKLKNLEKDENNISKKLEKTERTLKNKRFNQKYGEAYERLNLIKEEDKVYYEVGMFVVNYQKKYYQEMSKRQQDRKRYKNSHLKKHEKSLNKNPFYRFVEVEDAQRQEKKMDEFNRETEKIIILTYTKEKKSEFINLVVNKYNKDKKAVEEILNKEILSDKDKQTLFYFLDYYKDLHNTYTTEEGLKGKYPIAKIDENLPLLTLTNGLATTGYSINKTLMNYKNYYRSILSEIISEDEIIGREDMYLDDPEEKDKDNKMPIHGIIRGRLTLYTEENINIDEIFYDQIARKIDRKLYPSEFNLIQNFTEKGTNLNNKEIDVYDIKTINDRYKKHGKNHPDLAKEVENQTEKIIKNITEKKLKNDNDGSNPINNVSENEIGIFQLRANIKFGENLIINGKKGDLSSKENISNEEITTLYLYRQYLSSRESKDYQHIENIPNLNDILAKISDLNARNLLLKKFLVDIFLPIKNDKRGPIIENTIQAAYNEAGQGEPFSRILIMLINKYLEDESGKSNTEAPESRNKKGEHKTRGEIRAKDINEQKTGLTKMKKEADDAEDKRQEELKFQEQCRQANEGIKKIDSITKELQKELQKENKVKNRKERAKQKFASMFTIVNGLPNIPQLKQKGYDKNEIFKNCVGMLHNFFTEDEILNYFGNSILNQFKKIRDEKLKLFSEFNDDIDLLCRLEYPESENKTWGMKINIGRAQNIRGYTDFFDKNFMDALYKETKYQEDHLKQRGNYDYSGYNDIIHPDNLNGWNGAYIFALQKLSGSKGIFIEFPGAISEKNINGIRHERTESMFFKREEIKGDEFTKILSLINGAKIGNYKLFYDKSKGKPLSLNNFAEIKETKDGGYTLHDVGIEKTNNGNIKKTGKIRKSYKSTFIKRTREFRDGATSLLMGSEDFTKNMEKLEEFGNDFSKIEAGRTAFDKNELTDNLRIKTLEIAKQMKDKKDKLKQSGLVDNLLNQIEQFEKARNKGGMSFIDKNIRDAKESLKQLKNLITSNDIDNAVNMLSDSRLFYTDATVWDRVSNRINENLFSFLLAVGGAVLAIVLFVPTGGFSVPCFLGLLATAGIATAGGIVGGWAGTWIDNQRLSGTKTLKLNDGQLIEIHHSDKSYGSLDFLIDSINSLSKGDFKKGGKQFFEFIASASVERTVGTLTTAAFMGAGQLLGKGFSYLATKYPNNMVIKTLQKIPFNNTPKDPYGQQLCNSIGESLRGPTNAFKDFLGNYTKETVKELGEEGIEQATEAIDPKLGVAVTLRHSLSKKGTSVYNNNQVCIDRISRGYNGNNDRIHLRLSYNSNIKESRTSLETHLNELGYDFDSNTNTFIALNEANPKFLNVIELVPSTQNYEQRNQVSNLLSYGVQIDHETGKTCYSNNKSIQELRDNYNRTGKGVVTIDNKTGIVTIITKDKTITIEKSPTLQLIERISTQHEARKLGRLHKPRIEVTTDEERIAQHNGKNEVDIANTKLEDLPPDLRTEIIINFIGGSYFNGKSHQFNVTEGQTRLNSKKMDKILNEINEENKSTKLQELRDEINTQHKTATGQNLILTDEQLLSILDAHEEDGELGKLSIPQIRAKVKVLTDTITDTKVIRFLLEAGFCGQMKKNFQNLNENQNNNNVTEDDVKYVLEIFNLYGKGEIMGNKILPFVTKNFSITNKFDLQGKAEIIDYILTNSKLTLDDIEITIQNKKINIYDIKYAVEQSNGITSKELLQEIKKSNILLNIESEENLQEYLAREKTGSDITTGDLDEYITTNGLTKHAEEIKNRYYGNFNPETQKFTIARDIGNSDYDMKLIQNIINQQNIKPRGLETHSLYDLLTEIHNENHDLFILYSKYLQGEDVSSLAGKYSEASGGGNNKDLVLFWHTRKGNGPIKNCKYRIIGEFNPGEIIRSGDMGQITSPTANRRESERITLGEVSSENIVQIIDLETGKVIYDKNKKNIKENLNTNAEANVTENPENTDNINQLEDVAVSNIIQIRLNTICSEKITLNKSGLKEQEINQLFKNLETIKEITGKEKFSLNELQELIKYSENELKIIKLIKLKFGKYIESLDNIVDWVHFRYMKKDVFNALNDSTIRERLEQISGKNKWSLSNLRSLSETRDLNNLLDIISDPEIRQKLENLNGGRKVLIAELPALSDIKNLTTKLDNITNNLDKIKELTKENRLDIKYLDYYNLLTNITKDDLDKIASITKQDPLEIIKYISNSAISGENSEGVRANYTKLELINDNIFKMSREGGVDYIIINEYGKITLQDIGNNTFIYHAGMHPKGPSPSQKEIMRVSVLAGRAFLNLADIIPEGHKITETLSLSGDSFPLFLKEYQNDFHNNYTVRATGKMIYLNSQGILSPLSKLINKKCIREDAEIFEAATQTDAQEVADAINDLMKDRGMPLSEGQTITELAQAQVEYCEETGLWRVKIPQIEITKEYNNGVELSQQLNKCTTYNEMENILLANLSTEYHFRDGTLTGRDLLNRFSSYRDTYINGGDAFPKDIDPRRFFPAELIEPAKWKSEGTPTRRNTTRKSNIHILLDSK